MALTAYLKIDDIDGESTKAEHEDEILIYDLMWNIEQQSTKTGRGRSRTRAQVGALELKKYNDAASPYLILSCIQGKSFRNMVLSVRSGSGDANLDYLIITMQNVRISKLDTLGVSDDGQKIKEVLGLTFQNVTYKYTVQNDDHTAGDEHEVSFNISGGV